MLSVHGVRVTGGSFPAMIWRQFMREALADAPRSNFPYSKYYKREPQIKICRGTANMLANEACPESSTYYKTLSKEEVKKLKPCNMHDTKGVVPSVVGISAGAAAKKINAAGFKISKIYKNSSEPSGTIISQSPSSGQKIKAGATVKIYISKGAEKVATPSVVGLSEADASSALASSGFKVGVTYQAGAPEQAGKVISQNPAGGAGAEKGGTVTLVVGQ
jgi:membrane peptidoglycan carboxypeptidase